MFPTYLAVSTCFDQPWRLRDVCRWGSIDGCLITLLIRLLLRRTVYSQLSLQVLSHPWITGLEHLPNVNLSKSISKNLKRTFPHDERVEVAESEVIHEVDVPAVPVKKPIIGTTV